MSHRVSVDSAAPRLDVEALRARFPLLSRTVHGKPLIYLDNANTSQKPESVIAAVDQHYRLHNANVARAVLHQRPVQLGQQRAQQVGVAELGVGQQGDVDVVRGHSASRVSWHRQTHRHG